MTSPEGLPDPAPHTLSPTARLLRRPAPFDFFQAVALLEAAVRRGGSPSSKWGGVGKELDPEQEPIRFKSSLSLGFAPSDVTAVEQRGPGALERRRLTPRYARSGAPHTYSMEVSFFGLTGAHGALPLPFAELVARRGHLERTLDSEGGRRDAAMRELLDIFNHRLLASYYRAGKPARPALGAASPEETELLRRLASVIGLGTPSLLDAARTTHRPVLHTAGIATREARSAAAISVALQQALGLPATVPVRVVPFTGGWTSIEPSDRTSIGRAGRHHLLGKSAVLGGRLFDPSSGVRVDAGGPGAPLSYDEFRALMPGGDLFSTLCRVARFHVGPSIELSIRCTYHAPDPPPSRVRRPGAADHDLLGLTAVLGRGGPRRTGVAAPRTVTVPASAVRRAELREGKRGASVAERGR